MNKRMSNETPLLTEKMVPWPLNCYFLFILEKDVGEESASYLRISSRPASPSLCMHTVKWNGVNKAEDATSDKCCNLPEKN